MRKITVRRYTDGAADASPLYIYMESPDGDRVVDGTFCRSVGRLDGDGSVSFMAENRGVRLFFILAPEDAHACQQQYSLPAGKGDAVVTASCVAQTGRYAIYFGRRPTDPAEDTGAYPLPDDSPLPTEPTRYPHGGIVAAFALFGAILLGIGAGILFGLLV